MTTSDRVRQLVSAVRHTLANSPPPDDVTIEETDLGEERPPSDEDTEKDQEGTPELKREEIMEDSLAELDPESVGEGEVIAQPHQPSEAVTIMHLEEDKLTTGVMATSLPREIPVLPPTPTQQEKPSSLTQQPERASSLPVVTTSSLPTTTETAAPSILTRMESSGAEKEHCDDMLVVRTKVNR